MAGYLIENILTGKVKQMQWDAVENLPENVILLDTRTRWEYHSGHPEGAVHIPLDSLREILADETQVLPKENVYYVYCQSGLRSYLACRILSQYGYECYNIAGGYGFYQETVLDAVPEAEGKGPCGLGKMYTTEN